MNRIYLCIFFILFFINSSFAVIYTCNSTISCGCSSSPAVVTSRIIGGEAAANDTWGWAVSFQLTESHICGATLISYEYAITAAHCISSLYNISEYSIVVGTNDIYNIINITAQRKSIIEYFVHPDFDLDTLINDIAIVRFSPLSVSSNSTISLICLPADDQDPFSIGENLVAIGWGVTQVNDFYAYPYLEQVTLQAISPTENECVIVPIRNTTTQMCAGVNGSTKDTCKGDSGGPLMAFFDDRWVLVGITSSGHGCAELGYAGLYTRVSFFVPFIQNIINNQGITVRSTLRTTQLTTQLTTASTQKMNNKAGKQKNFLNGSKTLFIVWLLIMINI